MKESEKRSERNKEDETMKGEWKTDRRQEDKGMLRKVSNSKWLLSVLSTVLKSP